MKSRDWLGRRLTPYDWEASYGLTEHEINTLATYNSEKARGLMHTPTYTEQMRVLQGRFDTAARYR